MKIDTHGRVSGSTSKASGPPAATPGFSLGQAAAAGNAAPAAPASRLTGVASVDALLALQGVGDVSERRKRAVRRGGRILDALDCVRLDLLAGDAPKAALEALTSAVHEARDEADDPRLEALLDEIELRAAVELAKAEMSRAAA